MTERADKPVEGRRDALKKMAMGAASMTTLPILGQPGLASAMTHAAHPHPAAAGAPDPNWKPVFFNDHQNETVVALTDLIIPETDTPGAKAALVNRFMDLLLNEDDPAKQRRFVEGLAWIDARSRKLNGKLFVEAGIQEQTGLLEPLADPGNSNPDDRPGVEFFQQLKDLTIFGYYTSKVGMEQELQYGGDDFHAEYPGACTHPEHETPD